jgi:RNA polymerase sigma factor (sigma-70 family)
MHSANCFHQTRLMVVEGRVDDRRVRRSPQSPDPDCRHAPASEEPPPALSAASPGPTNGLGWYTDCNSVTAEPERKALLERLFACRALHARLYRRTRNRDEADDLAQEVFLRMLRLRDPSRVRDWQAYMIAIANNLLCREIGSRARRERGRVDVDDPVIQRELADSPSVADQIELEGYEKRLDEVMLELSPKCRSVMLLRRKGLTYKRIARSVGISPDMVKKYLRQVRVHCQRKRALERMDE